MRRPVAELPVNAILSIPGWRTSASPTSPPPGTTETTPSGSRSARHLGDPQGVQRGLRCRLDHDGAARDQCGNQLGHQQVLRHIPRDDDPDHPDGQPAQMRSTEEPSAALHPGEGARRLDRELHHGGRPGGLTQSAEACRRAHLGGDQISHLVDVAGVERRPTLHRRDPLGMAQPRPRAVVESRSRGANRHIDIGCADPAAA